MRQVCRTACRITGLSGRLILLALLQCLALALPGAAGAHWTETHRYLVDRALVSYANEGRGDLVAFLERTAGGKRYLDHLKDGILAADLRVAGIYAVDKHCPDPERGYDDCPVPLVFNDIPEIVFGGHKYFPGQPDNGYVPQEHIDRVERDWRGWHTSRQGKKLLAVLRGADDDAKKAYLLRKMRTSNADDVAKFFYNRALGAWNGGRSVDAFYNLGIALHLVQDVTTPEHSQVEDVWGDFERYEWRTYLQRGSRKVTVPGNYSTHGPEAWVAAMAEKSARLRPGDGYFQPARRSVEFGIGATAGLLADFFRDSGILSAPAATTGAASEVGAWSATLSASANPNGFTTTVYFEFGATLAYGSRTTGVPGLTGSEPLAVSEGVAGLSCGTVYHYRAVARSIGGTAYGGDAVFETAACPGALVWETSRAAAITLAVAQGKRVLMVAGRDTCPNTMYMKNTVCETTSPAIKQLILDHYVPWYCNVDTSTEWYPYANGLGTFTLPLICIIDPAQPDAYVDRTTAVQYPQAFYDRLMGGVGP